MRGDHCHFRDDCPLPAATLIPGCRQSPRRRRRRRQYPSRRLLYQLAWLSKDENPLLHALSSSGLDTCLRVSSQHSFFPLPPSPLSHTLSLSIFRSPPAPRRFDTLKQSSQSQRQRVRPIFQSSDRLAGSVSPPTHGAPESGNPDCFRLSTLRTISRPQSISTRKTRTPRHLSLECLPLEQRRGSRLFITCQASSNSQARERVRLTATSTIGRSVACSETPDFASPVCVYHLCRKTHCG